jgi:hypothetical protein
MHVFHALAHRDYTPLSLSFPISDCIYAAFDGHYSSF